MVRRSLLDMLLSWVGPRWLLFPFEILRNRLNRRDHLRASLPPACWELPRPLDHTAQRSPINIDSPFALASKALATAFIHAANLNPAFATRSSTTFAFSS